MLTQHTDPAVTLSEITAYQPSTPKDTIPDNELSLEQRKITLAESVDVELLPTRICITRKPTGHCYHITERHSNIRVTLATPNLLVFTSISSPPRWCKAFESWYGGEGLIRIFDLNGGQWLGRDTYEQASLDSHSVVNLPHGRILLNDRHCYSITPTLKKLFSLTHYNSGNDLLIPGSNLYVFPYYEYVPTQQEHIREIRIYELGNEDFNRLHAIKFAGIADQITFEPANSTIRILQVFTEKHVKKNQQEMRIDITKIFANHIAAAVPVLSDDATGIIQSYLTGCRSTFHNQKKQKVSAADAVENSMKQQRGGI